MSTSGYQELRTGAAIGAVAARAQLAVAGQDRAAFLQGLLTNDIPALPAGSGCYAAWLTAQGRMLTDLHVFQSDDLILLDVPAEEAEATLQRLDQFLFSEDVQLGSLAGSMTGLWIHGPAAPGILELVLGGLTDLAGWSAYQHGRTAFGDTPASVARVDQLGVPGFCVYLTPDREPALVDALRSAGAAVASPEALTAARIEAGYPVFGHDMTHDTIPLEAGIEGRAISFSKGCYVGQEVVIRVMHRGHGRVARRLVGLSFETATVDPGARLFSAGREIGHVTSAAVSPAHGLVALGYVHRDFTATGTAVEVESGPGRAGGTVTRGTTEAS